MRWPPLHERVAGAVEAAIADGRYRSGERLPTHRQLAQQFAVSIGSVTRAIDTLSARGVVRGEIGRGTFVLERMDAGVDDGGDHRPDDQRAAAGDLGWSGWPRRARWPTGMRWHWPMAAMSTLAAPSGSVASWRAG